MNELLHENEVLKKENSHLLQKLEQMKAEADKNRDVEYRLQVFIDNIPDKIYFKDRDCRFIMVNKCTFDNHPQLNRMEDFMGKTDLDLFPEETAKEWMEAEKKIMDTGIPIVNEEFMEPSDTGEEIWISTTKMPFRDKNGVITGIFGLSRNITRLKMAEKALQRVNESLEDKVQLRTQELQTANEGMKLRIQQLDYLNKKARFFTQHIDREMLLPVLFFAFLERFPGGEIHLCDIGEGGFRTAHRTSGLRNKETLSACIKALDLLDAGNNENIIMEASWMGVPELKQLFPNSLTGLPCYLVIPLVTDKKMRGVVQVFAPGDFQKTYEQDYMVLNTLASQAAMSLDNANNYKRLEERTRIQSELEIAHGIQKRFTPKEPSIPGLKIKGICHPANEVGGDYLDFFQNNHGEWVLVIADVCGKGIPAALVMTSLRSIIRTEAREQSSSKGLLQAVNNLMVPDLQADNSFITCMAIIIDRETKTMNFCRAGHPMIVDYGTGDEPKNVPSRGIALGMVDGETFDSCVEEVEMELKPGARFLAYTDGLNEAMNANKETYGLDRLMKLLKKKRELHPDMLVKKILNEVEEFSQGQRQYDDLTLFVMERE
ncbi:MAG: SpoIIE family protein phosphatase [Fibrobacteria bacterium]|nr:SpoIIE family protein phosphatase [Fibrobacteria bacterium]